MTLRLLELLAREHAAIGHYLEVLEQEARAMRQGDFAALPGLAQRKSESGAYIARLDREREAIQASLGFAAGRAGADALATAGGPTVQQAWDQLRARAEAARERNHRNGVMVHAHLDFTREALRRARPGSQALYGPDGGHARPGGDGHRLARG